MSPPAEALRSAAVSSLPDRDWRSRQHRFDDALGGDTSSSNSSGLFAARSRSSTKSASTISLPKASRSAVPASTGRKESSAPIRRAFPTDCGCRPSTLAWHRPIRTNWSVIPGPRTDRCLLKSFHAMAGIGRLLGALRIDEVRQKRLDPIASMDSKKKARCPPSRYCTLCFESRAGRRCRPRP